MKPQLTRTKKHPSVTKPTGAESSLSLQEELVAAIHGAFEVAVEMAVQEVMKLVGQATGGVYEEMRQENESLKQRLRRAEVMLKSARMEQRGGSSPPTKQHPDATACTDQPPHHKCNRKSPDPKVEKVHDFTGRRGDTRPSDQPPDPQHRRRNQEQRSANDLKALLVSEAASDPETNNGCAGACDALTTEVNEEVSPVCVERVESVTRPCHDDNLPPLPSEDDKSTVVQVTVKQEKPEEDSDGSASCLDSLKEEHFNSDCLLAVQSEMLVEWKPDALDIQSQDSVSPLPYTRLAQAHPPNLITNLSPPTDLQSLSSELPEAPPQVSGDNLRTSRNLGQTYTCKYCGQTFQLPSLLRRHYSQCQQKCYQQPVAGSRRTKLQLYPPGCSPFRCAVCNREFNRMENLKTHLRIHTGERPYTCTVCSKCFRHSGALTRHFRIHTGEKPYICGQCGKSFRNCGGLKFHQRSHSLQL